MSAARLLRLLVLLQERRGWTAPELAERLAVSTRTIRHDVERLRELGYPVAAQSGVGGGYRLGAGAALPPLLLDDEEAVAVAIGLRTAAGGTVAGIEETSLRALTKLDQVLPSRLRRRVSALSAHVVPVARGGATVDGGLLVRIVSACRDREGLRFAYQAFSGERRRRDVEPHELVHLGRFWYLVAWDRDRDDWRSFRLDRIEGTPSSGRRFARHPAPPDGFAAHVSRGRSASRERHRAEIVLHAPIAVLRERVPPAYGTLVALDEHRTLLRTGGDWLGAIAVNVALLEVDFEIRSPPELAREIDRLAHRFARAQASPSARGEVPFVQDARHGIDHPRRMDAGTVRRPVAAIRPQPLLAVADVEASSRWYRAILGAVSGHGGAEYERLLLHGELILQLHHLGTEHHHGPLADPSQALGNGVALWFEADDLAAVVRRIRAADAVMVTDVHRNPNAGRDEIWIRDPDGYLVVFAEGSPP